MSTEFEFALLDFLRYCYDLSLFNPILDHMKFYTKDFYDFDWGGNLASSELEKIFE